MALIARILGVSLLTSALVAGLLLALIQPDRHSSDILVILFLACVGGIIGAVAGAAPAVAGAAVAPDDCESDLVAWTVAFCLIAVFFSSRAPRSR